jgi:hypothetical protein
LQTKSSFLPLVLLLCVLPSQCVWADPMEGQSADRAIASPGLATVPNGRAAAGTFESSAWVMPGPLLTGSLAAGAGFGAGGPFRTDPVKFQLTSFPEPVASGDSLIQIPVPEPASFWLVAAGLFPLLVANSVTTSLKAASR